MPIRARLFFVVFAVPLAACTAFFVSTLHDPAVTAADGSAHKLARGRSTAFGRHLDLLTRAIPGNGGESVEGPGGGAEERFDQRAYPAEDIPVEWLDAASAAFEAVQARGVGAGKNSTDTWFSLGPTSAVYQETRFRRGSYVPSRYVSAGRVTTMAIGHECTITRCRLWMAAAGGGVWRTDDALQGTPQWTYLTGAIGINAVGSITVDSNDDNVIWIGTGEANASGDSAAGVGIYKSTDGGDTWTGPLGSPQFRSRAVGTIAIDPTNPNIVYAGSTRSVRGVSSVTGGAISLIPGAAVWGLYKSTDGGNGWTYIHNGAAAVCADVSPTFATIANNLTPCSPRGVRRVVLDPIDPNIVYASSYGRGVWRSTNGGTSWTQIKTPLIPIAISNAANASDRLEIAVTVLPNGKTRMYVGEGSSSNVIPPPPAPGGVHYYSRLYRSDDVAAGAPVFTDLTSPNLADPGYGSFDYCTGQCWYDQLVVTPSGHPDVVYLGGSYLYGEVFRVSNGRGVVLSTDAGVSFTDLTEDATNKWAPNGLHPDQHSLVVNPNNPWQFFEGNDGGVARSDGSFADTSARCDDRTWLDAAQAARCRQLLSRVPKRLDSLNKGLSTLQFQSLSVNPHDPKNIMGGTQDNGTFETSGSSTVWLQTIWGDGGQSGFDADDRNFRFHTFFNATPDVNFTGGAIHDWNWIGDRIFFSGEPQQFYVPMISDPSASGTLFVGLGHVWRTKTHGAGPGGVKALRATCNEFFGTFDDFCGDDWRPLGATGYTTPAFPFLPAPASYSATRLTASGALYGTDRAGGAVAAVERVVTDSSTLWAATSPGRVFVSKNADADPASAVVFRRIDPTSTVDPNRFVSSIHVDPANPNRAWISYSGFSASTPATPGHVFEVAFDPAAGTATWVSRDYDLGDLAITDLVRDDVTGDLYAASDFGVMRLAAGTTSWTLAADGMPKVEVAGLTIVAGARKLYAATHGLGAWSLTLP